MKGNKWRAFVLDLSFLLWYLLSALTLGLLGVFFVNPYYEGANAELYHALKAERESRDDDRYDDLSDDDQPEDVPQNLPQDLPENPPQNLSQDLPENPPQDLPEDLPSDLSEP